MSVLDQDEPVVRGTRKIDPFMTHQSDSAKEERKRTHNLLRSQLKQSMECRNTVSVGNHFDLSNGGNWNQKLTVNI